jgi:hypothetical protein
MGVDARVILSSYKSEIPRGEDVKVHTPDPTKYHDPAALMIGTDGDRVLAHVMGRTNGFGGWRGVVIPHATPLGGSMGFNHHKAATEVYIDPELNNKSIVIDMRQFQSEHAKAALARACSEAHSQCVDPKDAAVVTYGAFARDQNAPGQSSPVEVTLQRGNEQASSVYDEVRQAPVQMPGVYVAPKATPGGGQYKQASFSRQPPAPAHMVAPPPPPMQPYVPPPPNPEPPPMQNIPDSMQLREAFSPSVQRAQPQAPSMQRMLAPQQVRQRLVVFDMPKPFGRFKTYYHDVVRQDMVMVLVYDHSQMSQMVWFPGAMENDAGTPQPIATFVQAASTNEPDMIYLLHPTGLQFKYGDKEFCLLTIEKEMQAPKEALQ